MTFAEILLTILGALLIGVLFYYVFKSTGPWGTFWSFLLILILVGLAAEAWIEPVGPVAWGVAWVPTLFVVFLFALLLAAATPPRRDRRVTDTTTTEPTTTEEETAAVAVGAFFWIFMFFLLVVALWGVFI
jgi:hypothetical protein